ncbi:MAG TPA: ABC transporter permease [Gammaproteobacteria bacterium]|nr:ABC transporter permease [Gammaproteobacteria bacterium]
MLRHHLVLALRNARRAPLATAVNVLTLAIGLACFLTAYSFVAFLDRAEAHFPSAARTYVLLESFAFGNDFVRSNMTSTPEAAAEALEAYFPGVNATRAIPIAGNTSVASGSNAARLATVAVDPDFLDVFPLPFAEGDAGTALRSPRSAVLTREAAARLFGAADALGQPLTIANGVEATVVGVIDAVPEPSHLGHSASAPVRFDMLVSADVNDAIRAALTAPNTASFPGVNWVGGGAFTYVVFPKNLRAADIERALPDFVTSRVPANQRDNSSMTFGLLPVRDLLRASIDDELFSGDFGVSASSVLLALGALVLAVACVNYANLATARAARRVREVGVRKAIGAGPRQIALQHLFEAAALTCVALLAAFVVFRAALPLLETASGMSLSEVLLGGVGFYAFLAGLAAVATVAAGAYPALVLSRVEPIAALRSSLTQLGAKRLGGVLVGAQFAAASLLVIAVTVTWLQNGKLVRTGLGAVADPLVLIETESRMTKVDGATLRAELGRIPQVEGVTQAANLPWTRLVAISLVAASPDAAAERKRVLVKTVGLGFFEVLGIELLAGRVYGAELDDDAGGPGSANAGRAVVDRAFVEQFGFGSPAEAIGRVFYQPGFGGTTSRPTTIIGVVENRRLTFRGAGAEAVVYGLYDNLDVTFVRVSKDDLPGALAGIDAVWKRLAPNVAISRRFFDEAFEQAYERFSRLDQVFRALSLMALAISTAGLVGMASLVVGRRRREIGVRKTFGASTTQITAMLLTAFGRPVIVANAIAWPVAYFVARAYLRAFLDPIALGPAPFALALGVTLGVAWLAVGAQTVRAARLKPADVLRNE